MTTGSTIYLVDDDLSVRRSLGRLLRVAGYDVVLCDSPEAFLALPSFKKPACVLVDIAMPGMTGLELQRALVGTHPPVVMLSGHADAATARRALSDGAVTVLSKPVELNTLVRALELGLQRDRLQ